MRPSRRALLLAIPALVAATPVYAGEKAPAKSASESYLAIKTLTAYTNKPGGHRGVMTVDCGLEIPDPKLRDLADLVLPRLRAAYVDTLQTYAGGLPSGYPPNPDYLVRSLQRDTDRVLGAAGARVLLGAIVVN